MSYCVKEANMACLVTGGTGFIGSYTVRDLLDAGKEVVCLQRSGVTPVASLVLSEDKLNKVKIVQGDVSNTLQLFNIIRQHDIDLVVHTGAILAAAGSSSSETNPAYALQVNCVGMSNLLEAARLFGLKRIVWISSSQSLGGRLSEYYKKPVGDDDAIYMPDSMYSATKVLDEVMCRLYFRQFGVDSIGLRIGITLGIGKFFARGAVLTQFLKDVALNVPVTMAAEYADRIRGFCYVENLSDLIVKACDAPTTKTKTFNTVEYPCSIRQLVEAMCRANPEAKVTVKDGASKEEAILGGSPDPELDTSGIRKELGWKPKYSLEEALVRIFNYFRQQEGVPLL
jgi:nucleoside-diphosphate-sugar epimerase